MSRIRIPLVVSAALVAGLALVSPAAASPRADAPTVVGAYHTWVSTLEGAHCDGAEVADLYTPNAVLLATFKDYVAGRQAITKYFDDLTCKDDLRVETSRIVSGRTGSMGYVTGLYEFSYDGDTPGTRVTVPARFTFVFVLRNGAWRIVNHHSSQEPTAH